MPKIKPKLYQMFQGLPPRPFPPHTHAHLAHHIAAILAFNHAKLFFPLDCTFAVPSVAVPLTSMSPPQRGLLITHLD